MSKLNNSNEVSLVNANNFTTTKESRKHLLSLLNDKERKMFKSFIKSLGVK